jgi:cytochrome b subunit of formate dehydrogenase
MQEQPEVRRFNGLRIARTILKILTILGIVIFIFLIVSGLVTDGPSLATPGNIAEVLLTTLYSYVAYQFIDLALAIYDRLHRRTTSGPRPDHSPDLARTMLDEHHKRIEALEKKIGS